jgi:hypothetical protein
MKTPRITSPYAPDLGQVRVWIEQAIRALRFVELVAAVVALVTRMGEINGDLVKQLVDLRRKRPRSETLRRLERQLALPFVSLVVGKAPSRDRRKEPKSRRGHHPGRTPFPARLERVEVPNPVPAAQRICPICKREMTLVAHSRYETLEVIIKRFLGNDLARTVQCDGTSVTNVIERAGGKRPGCRVGGGVAAPAPHRSGRAELPHPVLHRAGSLAVAA